MAVEILAHRSIRTMATDDYTFYATHVGGTESHGRYVCVHAHLSGEEPHDKHESWGGADWSYRPIEGDVHGHSLLKVETHD